MDELDLQTCQILLQNSRTSYAELARRTGISAPSMHRRLGNLLNSKVLCGFTAHLSADYLDAIPVIIIGRTEGGPVKEAVMQLGSNPLTAEVMIGSGSLMVVNGLLRRMNEMAGFVDFAREVSKMDSPTVGIVADLHRGESYPPSRMHQNRRHLSPFDFAILRSIHTNSRKTVREIAAELNSRERRVTRHLTQLEREGVIEFGLQIDCGQSSWTETFTQIDLTPGTDRPMFAQELKRMCGCRLQAVAGLSNIPDKILCRAWFQSRQDHLDFVDAVCDHEDVDRVVSDVALGDFYFNDWRDTMLDSPNVMEVQQDTK